MLLDEMNRNCILYYIIVQYIILYYIIVIVLFLSIALHYLYDIAHRDTYKCHIVYIQMLYYILYHILCYIILYYVILSYHTTQLQRRPHDVKNSMPVDVVCSYYKRLVTHTLAPGHNKCHLPHKTLSELESR